jgi:hypothetical protein
MRESSYRSSYPTSPRKRRVDDRVFRNEHDFANQDAKDYLRIRLLITNYEAGVIIGRGGTNIKLIQDETGIHISCSLLSKPIAGDNPNLNNRVMCLTGSLRNLGKAIKMLVLELLSKSKGNISTLRILVPYSKHSLGKDGTKIEKLQADSGALVFPEDVQIAGTSERILELHGSAESLKRVICDLIAFVGNIDESPQFVLYDPNIHIKSTINPEIDYNRKR